MRIRGDVGAATGTEDLEKQPLPSWGDTVATTTTTTTTTHSRYEIMNRGIAEEKSHYVNLNTLHSSSANRQELPQYANIGKGRPRKGADPRTMSIPRK